MAIRAPDGANKSINRKIAIILTAKFNRIMLKEIFACFFANYPDHLKQPPLLQRKQSGKVARTNLFFLLFSS